MDTLETWLTPFLGQADRYACIIRRQTVDSRIAMRSDTPETIAAWVRVTVQRHQADRVTVRLWKDRRQLAGGQRTFDHAGRPFDSVDPFDLPTAEEGEPGTDPVGALTAARSSDPLGTAVVPVAALFDYIERTRRHELALVDRIVQVATVVPGQLVSANEHLVRYATRAERQAERAQEEVGELAAQVLAEREEVAENAGAGPAVADDPGFLDKLLGVADKLAGLADKGERIANVYEKLPEDVKRSLATAIKERGIGGLFEAEEAG